MIGTNKLNHVSNAKCRITWVGCIGWKSKPFQPLVQWIIGLVTTLDSVFSSFHDFKYDMTALPEESIEPNRSTPIKLKNDCRQPPDEE